MMNLENILLLLYLGLALICSIFFIIKFFNSKKKNGTIYLLFSFASTWVIINHIFWIFNSKRVALANKIVYLPQYSDWIITTPLSLLALAYFAMYNINKNRRLIITLIILDISMLVTGILAEYHDYWVRYLYYGLGFIPFVIIAVIIWYTLRLKAKEQSLSIYPDYLILAGYISFLWSIYPIAWLMGPFGFFIITHSQVISIIYILNLFTKAGYYFLYYSKLQRENNQS